jgi:hypothetical protein
VIFYTSVITFFHDLACNRLNHELSETGNIVLFCEYPARIINSRHHSEILQLFSHSLRDLPHSVVRETIDSGRFHNAIKLLNKDYAILYGSRSKFKFLSHTYVYEPIEWHEVEDFILSRYGFFVHFDTTFSPHISLTSQLQANEDCFFEVR